MKLTKNWILNDLLNSNKHSVKSHKSASWHNSGPEQERKTWSVDWDWLVENYSTNTFVTSSAVSVVFILCLIVLRMCLIQSTVHMSVMCFSLVKTVTSSADSKMKQGQKKKTIHHLMLYTICYVTWHVAEG